MKSYYRSFLLLTACSFLFSCSDDDNQPTNIRSETSTCISIDEDYTVYSTFFKPKTGWVGDPMPFYDNGKIHVFYLFDARDGEPTFHPWNKITTQNFASYEDNGLMIACGDAAGQERALGTGSVFKHNNIYYAFYTAHNGDLDPKEKIMVATSTDLNNWTKNTDFVLEASWGYDRNEFRDPFILKDETTGLFNMLISTRSDYKGSWRAVIAKYSSPDLINWTLEDPFYDDSSTFMVECPDVFSMGNYQYLIYSDIDDRKVHYKYRKGTSGDWTKPVESALDGITFYAGKTVADNYDRYVVGWAPTRSNSSDYANFDWAGSLVAHKLIQNEDGTLSVTYPHGINEKISKIGSLNTVQSNKTTIDNENNYTLDASSSQAFTTFTNLSQPTKITSKIRSKSSSSFGFEFKSCGDRNEVYALTFDLNQKHIRLDRRTKGQDPITIDKTSLQVPQDEEFDVTLFIENSICIIYVNHQIAFTSRIYAMNGNQWSIFADNGIVEFSDLKFYN